MISYLKSFISDAEFRENQPWVKRLGKFLAAILPANGWTSSRFMAPFIPALNLTPFWTLIAFGALLLTDTIDGLVARCEGKEGTAMGAFLDGLADGTLALTAAIYLISPFVNDLTIVALILVEIGVCFIAVFIKIRGAIRIGAGAFSVFYGDSGKTLFKHMTAGKIKFWLESVLILLCGIGKLYAISSVSFQYIANVWMLIIIGFAIFSGIQKIEEVGRNQ